jgi:hypothetical protein
MNLSRNRKSTMDTEYLAVFLQPTKQEKMIKLLLDLNRTNACFIQTFFLSRLVRIANNPRRKEW